MKKMTSIVVSLLMVGVYAEFSSAQEDAPRRPEAEREGDSPRRPGAEGERRPGGRRPGAEGARRPGADGERRPGGPGGGNFMARLPIFAALDTDMDGVLSEEEIATATASLKKLDKNGDGKLDAEELRPDFGGRGPGARPGAEGGDRPRRPGAEGGDRPRRPGAQAGEGDRPRRPNAEGEDRPRRPASTDDN